MTKRREFFIAIDSDGCVFDTMEIKHKECFCPAAIKHFALQPVSRYAREAWEFVNLYSAQRGTNRFPALVSALDLLRERPEVQARGATVDEVPELRRWIASESRLGTPTLRQAVQEDSDLERILAWSNEVNERIDDMVHGVPPFPLVRESLERAAQEADMIVSSGTPLAALHREWGEHGLAEYVQRIAGQEDGPKTQHLSLAAAAGYASEHMLMIGDAPGDLKAAQAVGACFFPIIPGKEEASWRQFLDEGLGRFLAGQFTESYQASLIAALDAALPRVPSWQ